MEDEDKHCNNYTREMYTSPVKQEDQIKSIPSDRSCYTAVHQQMDKDSPHTEQ